MEPDTGEFSAVSFSHDNPDCATQPSSIPKAFQEFDLAGGAVGGDVTQKRPVRLRSQVCNFFGR